MTIEGDLSVEPERNKKILITGAISKSFKFYYGTVKWGRAEWIGKIYPQGTKARDFLIEYAKHHNAVEVHSTHYKLLSAEDFEKWLVKVEGADFTFCPKAPQIISYNSHFEGLEEKTNSFFESLSGFGNHLGPVYFQISHKFSPKKKESLFKYLSSLPHDIQIFLEVRHPDWFEQPIFEELLNFLTSKRIGLVILDAPSQILRLELTVPICYIRYTPTNNPLQLLKWVKKIKEWQTKGLEKAYFFIETGEDQLKAIEELQMLKELINEAKPSHVPFLD